MCAQLVEPQWQQSFDRFGREPLARAAWLEYIANFHVAMNVGIESYSNLANELTIFLNGKISPLPWGWQT